jgi:hypothetical protein
VDSNRVVWFQNPTWKLRTIIQGQTKPDNVCIAAHDIDGDGQVDFALGAEWKPFNTKSGGTLQWLRRGKSLDEPWDVFPIADDIPTIHRIRFANLDGSGQPQLVVAPLMGQNSTAAKNWSESSVELAYFTIPKEPVKDRWAKRSINRTLSVVHNIHVADVDRDGQVDLLCASYEGVTWVHGATRSSPWKSDRIGAGDQSQPSKSRGASEVTLGRLGGRNAHQQYVATIEPWHGHQVVVYTPKAEAALEAPWQRRVIDDQLKWGHAVASADLTGTGRDTLVVGVRDTLSQDHPCGVRLYHPNADGTHWTRQLIDPGGVAVEDLTVADLNADGKPDIIAVGRATGNVRIYWNVQGR